MHSQHTLHHRWCQRLQPDTESQRDWWKSEWWSQSTIHCSFSSCGEQLPPHLFPISIDGRGTQLATAPPTKHHPNSQTYTSTQICTHACTQGTHVLYYVCAEYRCTKTHLQLQSYCSMSALCGIGTDNIVVPPTEQFIQEVHTQSSSSVEVVVMVDGAKPESEWDKCIHT